VNTAQSSHTPSTGTVAHNLYRFREFDAVAEERSVADILRARLEDAEAQLRVERRRARRAERRAKDLARAVNNWYELIEDFERTTNTTFDLRRN